MKAKLSSISASKARSASVFPASIVGANGVTVDQSGRVTTIGIDLATSELGAELNQAIDAADGYATSATGSATAASASAVDAAASETAASASAAAAAASSSFNVRGYGAVGDNVTDDTAAIQAALDAAKNLNNTGGMVYLPPGNYKVTSQLTMSGDVTFFGAGRGSSIITASGDFIVLFITGGIFGYGGLRDMWVIGNMTNTASQATVSIDDNLPVTFMNVIIWGGTFGLKNNALDGYFANCYIAPAPFSSSGGCVTGYGANWYNRCKFDGIAFVGFQIIAKNGSGLENRFSLCDFSGTWGFASVQIDDSASTPRIAFTRFSECVFSGNIVITSASSTCLSVCEVSALSSHDSGDLQVIGCYGFGSPVVGGTSTGVRVLSGNIGIT